MVLQVLINFSDPRPTFIIVINRCSFTSETIRSKTICLSSQSIAVISFLGIELCSGFLQVSSINVALFRAHLRFLLGSVSILRRNHQYRSHYYNVVSTVNYKVKFLIPAA